MRHRRLLALALLLVPVVAASQAAAPPRAAPTLKSILLEQLRSTHNHAEWFVPVNAAVAGLTPDQARWIPHSEGPRNPATADHSVGMLASHLLFWNTEVLARMHDPKAPPYKGSNDETFNRFDAASWTATCQKLDQVLTEMERAVESADDAQLRGWASQIAHVGAHNAYHTGQIIEIRKLQGSWNPEHGVK